jgi:hypothetical protein
MFSSSSFTSTAPPRMSPPPLEALRSWPRCWVKRWTGRRLRRFHPYRYEMDYDARQITAAYYARTGPLEMLKYRGPGPSEGPEALQVVRKQARDEVSATYREFLKQFPPRRPAQEGAQGEGGEGG